MKLVLILSYQAPGPDKACTFSSRNRTKTFFMNWETVTSSIGQSVYALWNNGKKLVTLAFNPASSAVRIEYNNEKRVFLIRKEGFLKNKTVLCNEYGIRIGHTGSENNEHFIVMNNERFFYKIENDKEPALSIYKEFENSPLAVCTLGAGQKNMVNEISQHKPISDNAHYSLLMTLCWYLFQPVIAEKAKLEYTL